MATLPEGVPAGAFGPRLQATIGLLTGAYRLSKRNVVELMADLFGVRLALGSIKRVEEDLARALTAPVAEAKEHVKTLPALGLDETHWRQRGVKAWLWVVTAPLLAVFVIRFSRGAKVARELLGESYSGTIVTDRWSGYTWVDLARRQLCWAHMKRDFEKLVEAGGELGRIGEALQARRKQLFVWWYRVRDGTLQRSTFQKYVRPLRAETKELLRQAAARPEPKLPGMCAEILKLEPALWSFVRVPGLEPTNNQSERALRPAVIWRKTSFGTQSDEGTEFVERMLTVFTTLRLQGRNVLDYLAAVTDAVLHSAPIPSILPTHEAQNALAAA